MPNTGKIIIEIKSGLEIVKPLVALIKKAPLNAIQIELISFNLKVLSEIKKHLPEYKMLWLLDLDYYIPAWMLWTNKNKLSQLVTKNKLDGVNVWAGKTINSKFLMHFKKHNLLVYTWTVNDINIAKKIIKMGVDAITTDRPAWIKGQLKLEGL